MREEKPGRWGGETDSILKWVGIGILVLAIAAAIGFFLNQEDAPEAVGESQARLSAGDELELERQQVKDAVTGYLGASDLESKLQFVRRREMVEPLMRDYYEKHDLYPTKIWNFEHVEPALSRGSRFGTLRSRRLMGKRSCRCSKMEKGSKSTGRPTLFLIQ